MGMAQVLAGAFHGFGVKTCVVIGRGVWLVYLLIPAAFPAFWWPSHSGQGGGFGWVRAIS